MNNLSISALVNRLIGSVKLNGEDFYTSPQCFQH